MKLEVGKCPITELTFSNHVVLHPEDVKQIFRSGDRHKSQFIKVSINGKGYVFAFSESPEINIGSIGFNGVQRKWLNTGLYTAVDVDPFEVKAYLGSVTLEIGFLAKNTSSEKYDTEKMAEEIRSNFMNTPLSSHQDLFFRFEMKKPYLSLKVLDMTAFDSLLSGQQVKHNVGLIMKNTIISFDRKEDSVISITGKLVGKSGTPNIINPDWDFTEMGIGGLDSEFNSIFRRAFASRVFPPDLIEELGMSHVKGILLHGPPGTGKTLMARQVGKMLNTREPKIVNGPEILNKYVGESEKNIRDLFKDAEDDQKKYNANSPLHMIIFDEIDAICKQRGTVTGSTGVADTVVNQLLSKIDGVEQLNNILIIGMTNRKDMIDEALLRPGRLEVQMEIGLPDEDGRVQILDIHTAKLFGGNKIAKDVNIRDLASRTKNFSGAELEGLVRAASTTAMNRLIKVDGKVTIDRDAVENLVVTNRDFLHAIAHDCKPKFGAGSDDADHFQANGIINYGSPIKEILDMASMLINQAKNGKMISPVTLLLQGVEGSGKTSLAAHIAYKMSTFPCIKVCSPEKMIGYSEGAKCQAIKQIFDDAAKSELSCIIVDDIERLLDFVPIGPRFSNIVLQTLNVLLKKNLKRGKRLLIIGTSSLRQKLLRDLQLYSCFHTTIDVPAITDIHSMGSVLRKMDCLEEDQIIEITKNMASVNINVDIKRLTSLAEMICELDDTTKIVPEFVSLLKGSFANDIDNTKF